MTLPVAMLVCLLLLTGMGVALLGSLKVKLAARLGIAESRVGGLVALFGFFKFLERHHVHRPHVVELRAHFAVSSFFQRKLLTFHQRDFRVCAKIVRSYAEFIQAGFSHVCQVRLQLGQQGADFAFALARGVQLQAGRFQFLVDFCNAGAYLIRLVL